MADFLGELQEQFGYLHPNSKLTRSVGETSELRRIRDAPRRTWQDDPQLPELVRLLTLAYRHTDAPTAQCLPAWPSGRPRCAGCEAKTLLPRQAKLLQEAHDSGEGAFGVLRVGGGKTLISLLLPTVLKAERPLLVVPADLKEKTLLEARQYALHWRVAPMKVVSYHFLANPKNQLWLWDYKPDLIVLDESENASPGSKCAKRIGRYKKAFEKTRVVPMSGTPGGRSIKDYWHTCRWALGSRAPVPADPLETGAWAYAMDEKVPPEARFDPGALLSLAPTDASLEPEVRARLAYRARFNSTPGVVCTTDDVPPVGLKLWTTDFEIPAAAQEMIAAMREDWTTPDGHDFSMPMDLWRHARDLGCGFFYKWDPYPPDWWLFPRRAWHKFAREALKYSRTKDSVTHIIAAIEAGEMDDGGLYKAWKDVEDRFVPNPVPVWVHDSMVRHCTEWLRENPKDGLVWAERRAFGERLSELSGRPYFRQKGLDAQGRLIDSFDGGSAVVSVKSCGKGHNLQQYRTNLIPSPPSVGKIVEQLLGRTHREGQGADVVLGEFLLTCRESYQSMAQAIRDAKCIEERDGQLQKLCYAQRDFRAVMSLVESPEENWTSLGV